MRLSGWLRQLLRGSDVVYRPQFGPKAVLAVAAGARNRPASFDDAAAALARGAHEEARALFCRHFRSRHRPRFFLTAEDVARRTLTLARQRPAWRTRTLQAAVQACVIGLPVYAVNGPPLDAAYPWTQPIPDGAADRLYWLRPHRFAFAPQLALAGIYDGAWRAHLPAIVRSWMAASLGAAAPLAYSTTLVVAQRVLALDWARTFVAAGGGDEALEADLLEVLAADIAYLMPRIGTAVANNHLLAERFIDWYLRLLYPELTEGGAEEAEARWLEEVERQTYADGGGFEHALHYHELGCEMLLAYAVLMYRNGRDVQLQVRKRLLAMLDFQIAASAGSEPLSFGNATEDPMFPLDTRGSHACAGWRALRRALDGNGLPEDMDDPGVERVFWLLGGLEDLAWFTPRATDASPERTERTPPSLLRLFPTGGLARFDDPALNMSVVLRTGPTDGVPVFGGHMHADLLSLYILAAERPLVTDAGTYSYRRGSSPGKGGGLGNPAASWFAGAAAHNGYYIPGADPLGPIEGDFRPYEPLARVRITLRETGRHLAAVAARIEGGGVYEGCLRGVVHVTGRYWLVWHVPGSRAPVVGTELRLQVAVEAAVTLEPDGVRLTSVASGEAMILPGPGLKVEDVDTGTVEPPSGWISPAYGVAMPAPQIRLRCLAPGCSFAIAPPGVAKAVSHTETLSNGGLWVSVTGDGYTDTLLLGGDGAVAEGGGVRFRGRLLWLRVVGGRLAELRAIGLRSVVAPSIGLVLDDVGQGPTAGAAELGDDEIAIGNGLGTT